MRNAAPWIVAIAAVGLCFFILSAEREAMDNDAEAWLVEEDSLRAELDRTGWELDTMRAYTDTLRVRAERMRAERVHDTVYIPLVWRRVKLMDINAKMDSLKSL